MLFLIVIPTTCFILRRVVIILHQCAHIIDRHIIVISSSISGIIRFAGIALSLVLRVVGVKAEIGHLGFGFVRNVNVTAGGVVAVSMCNVCFQKDNQNMQVDPVAQTFLY